mmetsp:Transcript_24581/g.67841  ORF Transcript_24581/g.67841 Transcript_24581/m.67841 type:complete len:812 (+) Transcript_24581:341-2776(+)|eukprot:CAMPEP_0172359864 /NCGR_PEP_ID=MMETSP1060-20121228/3982_1 /TAXON_ID=37318 /ORGANISM="Pseudo-nitzschia pungens, Strain cf. cingulata" /LENGTH=811 /DNA_ID=CAMNT_0013081675 /DNA_START=228 /DNA_END=2663 /DNA_ORIENTATION=+
MTNNENGRFSNEASGGLDDSYSDERAPQIFFLCFSTILVVVLFLSRLLEDSPRLRTYLSEPAMTLLVGMFCSLIVRLLNESDYEEYQNHYQSEHDEADQYYANNYDDQYQDADEDFDESEYASKYLRALPNFFLLFPSKIFFLVLLPPILFNSGYQLQRELFYRHFGAIALFSIVGTALSAFGAGGFLWFLNTRGWLGDAFEPTPMELLTFGALIAATDTVSVVGVLQRKRVDPHLFSLVFGESALNDAVALVLFKTLSDFLRQNAKNINDAGAGDESTDMYGDIGKYLLDLLVQCVVSPMLGLIFASVMGLAFKHGKMGDHMMLELSLYILPVYMPFMLAELLELSGMITIFFSGIFARRYMEPNVSEETREYARILFQLLAFLAEICIFLELGLSVCGMHKGHFSLAFVAWAFVAALLGRAVGVYPLSLLYNLSLTRPVLSAERAKTIAVEMITKGKCTTCTEMDMSDVYRDSNMDNSQCKNRGENLDTETPPVTNHPGLSYIAMDTETKEEIKLRNIHNISNAVTPPPSGREGECSTAGDSTSSSNTSLGDGSVVSSSYCPLVPTVVSNRETPQRKRDKIIPMKFMHLLWFAGLRGAVAYACAREFPDVYGHRDDFIAATMIIVIITIVLMGGATEPLMDRLDIRMNVDNDEYMRAWHQQRKLKGRFLHFEYHWIYKFVVRGQSIRLMDESCRYIEQVDDNIAEDDMIVGIIPGRDVGATLMTKRRKDGLRVPSAIRHGRNLAFSRSRSSRRDIMHPERSFLTDESVRNKSLFHEKDEEDAANIDTPQTKVGDFGVSCSLDRRKAENV